MCHEIAKELIIDVDLEYFRSTLHKPFENLKKLTIGCFCLDIELFKTFFRNVEYLVLTKAYICVMKNYCKYFPNLKSFELYRTELSEQELNEFKHEYPVVSVNIMHWQKLSLKSR